MFANWRVWTIICFAIDSRKKLLNILLNAISERSMNLRNWIFLIGCVNQFFISGFLDRSLPKPLVWRGRKKSVDIFPCKYFLFSLCLAALRHCSHRWRKEHHESLEILPRKLYMSWTDQKRRYVSFFDCLTRSRAPRSGILWVRLMEAFSTVDGSWVTPR